MKRVPISILVVALFAAVMMAQRADVPAEPLIQGSYLQRAFTTGETLEFDLSWLRLAGGQAEMVIAPVAGESNRTKMHSLFQSRGVLDRVYHVEDLIETIVESDTFSTVHFHKRLNERNKIKDDTTVMDYGTGIATRKGKEVRITRPLLDPLSAIYHLRRFKLKVGSTLYFTAIGDGKIYKLEAAILRKEKLRTEAGTFNTLLVQPKMRQGGIFRDENNRLLIWYSDDDRHLPVRIQSDIAAGSITANLRSFRVGTR
ncbi:MAG: DUF3108 domain-containing protein [Acidobacteriota bacterium]